jgi:hypothetical protein
MAFWCDRATTCFGLSACLSKASINAAHHTMSRQVAKSTFILVLFALGVDVR